VGTSWIPGQARVTQAQYTQILLKNLEQLWTDYGELAEVWFDGGFPEGSADAITALAQRLQPNAVGFQGPGRNVVRWAGTEGGHVQYPFWSAAKSSRTGGAGDPNGAVWAPGEADTCFQTGKGDAVGGGAGDAASDGATAPYGGCWFYNAGMVPKSLPELVSSYHDTVGKNAVMLLDLSPTQVGDIRADHLERYKEFGSWIRACYAKPVAQAANASACPGAAGCGGGAGGGGPTATLTVPAGVAVDRAVLMEEQRLGQLIRGYEILTRPAGAAGAGTAAAGAAWAVAATGSSVGHKRIAFFDKGSVVAGPTGLEVALNVTAVAANASPAQLEAAAVSLFSLFNCSRTPTPPAGCKLQQDFAYKVLASITIKTIAGASEGACCAACGGELACAVFVLGADKTCTLLSANQGGAAAAGAVSGAPIR
jgi:hypothetical protein